MGRLQRTADEFHQFSPLPFSEPNASDFNHIVEHALNVCAQSSSQIQTETNVDENVSTILMAPGQIAQVLQNRIKNAIGWIPKM